MQTKRRRWERGKARLADAPYRAQNPNTGREGAQAAFPGAVPLTHPQLPLCQLITLSWGQNPVACSENRPV